MTRKLLLLISLVFTGFLVYGQTSLAGNVTDDAGEPIIGATVSVFKNGVMVTGTQTDFDGNYNISNLDPGTIDVEFRYVGFEAQRVTDVLLRAGQVNPLNSKLSAGVLLQEAVIVEYKVPLIEQDNTTSGGTITSEQIRRSPLKDVSGLASTTAGVSSVDGGAMTVRGSRSNATDYYIDGIRVRASQIPQTEIDQLQVITGGMEAKYGDVTGGIISITTKGPSSVYTGGLEVETSKGLDPFGRLELNGNLSGPILRKKESKESILGFRVAGRYLTLDDRAPSAVGVYRATEEQIAMLSENPYSTLFNQNIPEGEFLDHRDIPLLQARPNENARSLDLNGKIDWRVSPGVDVSLTGGYFNNFSRFDPGRGARINGSSPNLAWGLFNHINNPLQNSETLRTNLRIRHRIGKTSSNTTSGATSLIQNLAYTIQIGYETNLAETQDWQHRDRIFDYGHVGRFDSSFDPIFSNDGIHVGYSPTLRNFDPMNSRNPVLANYNLPGDSPFQPYLNGLVDGTGAQIYNTFHNVGGVYDNLSKSQVDTYTGSLAINFDLVPGGSSKGRHTIELGAWIEQREIRAWQMNPFNVWNLAQQEVNVHLSADNIDTLNGVDTVIDGTNRRLFPLVVSEVNSKSFHLNFRNQFGIPVDEWVFLNEFNPEDLSLDMFSANQLVDPGLVSMYGYDFQGNKVSGLAFEDFYNYNFFGENNGQPSYQVAPDRPFYFAGYIQDKFSYKDIIFRVGLRVDAFDANTKVMRDPFSLYPIQNAADFHDINASNQPSGIGDDYKVYVTAEGSSDVKGYRSGNTWFDANGNQLNDGNFLFGGELVNPAYEPGTVNDIQDPNFDLTRSFEDYRIRLNPMPRISISFPISDEANFFGSYDILYQRPPGRNFVSPLDYYFYDTRTPVNNANLNPEQTINYEVGFQQKLTNASAIKINAYYKELRDMIQRRYFLYLPNPVNENLGFDNIDFGTVKGFTFAYDLRRTGNFSLQANYTLQFADGTGSDDRSQEAILRPGSGNLRYLLPLSYDERHSFNVLFDLRWDGGSRYNGPRIGNFNVLENTGLNVQASAVSGRPFTRGETPARYGSVGIAGQPNGARLPWNYNINLRLDRDIAIGGTRDGRRQMNLNIYLRVSNLLNTLNLRGLYAAGDENSDGYLASYLGQLELTRYTQGNTPADVEFRNMGRDVDNFIGYYNMAMLNPGFFFAPRRIFLGAIFEF